MKVKSYLSILAVIISLIMIIPLASCASQSTTAPTSPIKSNPPATTSSAAPAVSTAAISSPSQSAAITLNVSGAASLTDVLKAINAVYTQNNPNITISPNFASSGTLQTQIEQGAPADIFISAAAAQMDNLQKENLILTDTRKNLLYNKVVLIVPNDSTLGLTSFNDLTSDKVKKIAIGDPKSVPAGTYAQQAFTELGITDKVQPKEILGSDVRQVLTYVESDNVDAGVVYSTDALTSSKVKIVASAPADINAKVVYPVAVIKASKNPEAARSYLNFLSGDQAKALFEKYGFTVASQ